MPRFSFGAIKRRTNLHPERGENDERYPIEPAMKRYGVRPPIGVTGKTFQADEDRTQSPSQCGAPEIITLCPHQLVEGLIRISDNCDSESSGCMAENEVQAGSSPERVQRGVNPLFETLKGINWV